MAVGYNSRRASELIQDLKELRCPTHGQAIRNLMTYRFENGRFEAKWTKTCCSEMSRLASEIVDSQFAAPDRQLERGTSA
jgi:hypothetical protein